MASLIGIRILCKAGCKVTFNDEKCEVVYKNTIILRGYKDLTTDLWTLPLTLNKIAKTTLVEVTISPNSAPCNPIVETAGFFYALTNKINSIKFAHQSLCNMPIASLIKAINAGFLKGALHLDAHSVQKYIFASPATSKGRMKQPQRNSKYLHYKAHNRNPGVPTSPKTTTSRRPYHARPKPSTAQQ